MRASHPLTATALVAVAAVALTGCVQPPPDPLPTLPPYTAGTYSPSTLPPTPTATPTGSATATPSTTTTTTTPTSPTVAPTYPTGTPTPIPGFPTDHTLAAVNTHIGAGTWAFVQIPSDETTDRTTVAIRVNGLWQGPAGSLANRSPDGQSGIDMAAATPYFLSWSYVVTEGDPLAVPPVIVLPTAQGKLFSITGPLADRDCPNHESKLERGLMIDLKRCSVAVSDDGGSVSGLALAVPGQTKQYWYFDAPAPVLLPS